SNGYIRLEDANYALDDATGPSQERSVLIAGIAYTNNTNMVVLEKGSNLHFVVQTNGSSNAGKMSWRLGGLSVNNVFTTSPLNDGMPRNMLFHWKNETNGQRIFIDGELDAYRTIAESPPVDDNNDFVIGSRFGSYTFPGTLEGVFVFARGTTVE
ncbi:MAG: hypothetical protein CUN57_01780, partial [Phototrophicales bacterium]